MTKENVRSQSWENAAAQEPCIQTDQKGSKVKPFSVEMVFFLYVKKLP